MRSIIILLTALALAFSGCAFFGSQPAAPATAPQEPTAPIEKKSELPEFSIKTPAEGSDLIAGDTVVELDSQYLSIGELGSPKRENQGHFLLYLDDGEPAECLSTNACKLKNVSAGEHALKVELRNNDGSEYRGVDAKTVKFRAILPAGFDILYPFDTQAAPIGTVVVKLRPINFEIGEIGEKNEPNKGYFLLYLDGQKPSECLSFECPLSVAATGKHTLKVELRSNDGAYYKDSVAREISFTAIGAAG